MTCYLKNEVNRGTVWHTGLAWQWSNSITCFKDAGDWGSVGQLMSKWQCTDHAGAVHTTNDAFVVRMMIEAT